jgi:hypothetical protein
MKPILAAASLTLIAALSTLAPSTLAVAQSSQHGYVNYRNYDDGPESLAAFRAYHRSAGFRAANRSEPGAPSSAGARDPAAPSDRAAAIAGAHCDLAPRAGAQGGTSVAIC